jgi:hypothetical protein
MIGIAFVLGISIGAYFGSVQLAGSTPKNGRLITLLPGDHARFGRVECETDSGRPLSTGKRTNFLRCYVWPLSLARYETLVTPHGIAVIHTRTGKQLYVTP